MLKHRLTTILAATSLAALAAAAPASAAKPVAYEGKTSAGVVAFERSGNTVTDLRGYVATACASSLTSDTKAGADSFFAMDPIAIGSGEVTQTIKADTALGYGTADKTARVTLTRGAKGVVHGKVVSSFMVYEPYYNAWGHLDANTFVCQGEGTFTAKPVVAKRKRKG